MLRILSLLFFALTLWPTSALAADVSLKTQDGTKIYASYNAVRSATKGVVLVHMSGRSSKDWRFLAEKLNQAGLATIAMDLRGHGANVPEGATPPVLTDADYMAMTQDVAAAVAYLRTQGIKEVGLVGASLGASLALKVASQDAAITNLVLLSPLMNQKGIDAAAALSEYGARPVLIVVSKEDSAAAKAGLVLDSQAKGYHQLEVYDGAGNGTKMLNKAPGLEPLLVSWLLGTARLADDAPTGAGAAVSTGDTSAVQTTGKKLGE